MKKNSAAILAALCMLVMSGFAHAGDPPGMPHRGQSMDQIRSQYGEPVMTKPSVGTPPITVWEYPGYFVYFEHNLVITSVAN